MTLRDKFIFVFWTLLVTAFVLWKCISTYREYSAANEMRFRQTQFVQCDVHGVKCC